MYECARLESAFAPNVCNEVHTICIYAWRTYHHFRLMYVCVCVYYLLCVSVSVWLQYKIKIVTCVPARKLWYEQQISVNTGDYPKVKLNDSHQSGWSFMPNYFNYNVNMLNHNNFTIDWCNPWMVTMDDVCDLQVFQRSVTHSSAIRLFELFFSFYRSLACSLSFFSALIQTKLSNWKDGMWYIIWYFRIYPL